MTFESTGRVYLPSVMDKTTRAARPKGQRPGRRERATSARPD